MPRKPPSSRDEDPRRNLAERFARSPRVSAAIQAVLASPEKLPRATKDPVAFFASYGVKIPKTLEVELFTKEPRSLPGPEWFPFVLEFFNCRTFWVAECDNQVPPLCRWREETVCFGLRVLPRFIPRIA
jgi:hypothetical protein